MFGTPFSLCPHEPSPLPRVSRPSSTVEIPIMCCKIICRLNPVRLVSSKIALFSGAHRAGCRWGLIAGAAQLAVPKGRWAARRLINGHLELSLLLSKLNIPVPHLFSRVKDATLQLQRWPGGLASPSAF